MTCSKPKSLRDDDRDRPIYRRRAVRNYAPQGVEPAVIRVLLEAAVHATTAMHEEAWAFAVIQDGNLYTPVYGVAHSVAR